MDLGLTDRVALVTGAGRGIGRQICLTLASESVRLAVNDFYPERAEAVANEIKEVGGRAIGLTADVTDSESVQQMVQRALGEFGRLDILVNNAGIPVSRVEEGGPYFTQSTRTQWDRTMHVIVYGVMNCSRAVIEHMCERRWGRIISIISDAGRIGEPRLVAYSAAKGSVVAFTKALAKEVGRSCVTVNCVSPATTETEATAAWIREHIEQLVPQYPMGKGLNRLGRPDDIANAVAFLASERAEWITGQVLSVNGGYSMVD
ncbi:MAG: 3-oxoacyl-ACP reductase family protein [Dehalococcoidia bacterium]|jgi:NAD(P)-dependent dehydrogenase (short-subunit alcohol dehydrogenase family)